MLSVIFISLVKTSKKENEMKKIILSMIVVLVTVTSLTGCNTWKGMGTDMRETGASIEGE